MQSFIYFVQEVFCMVYNKFKIVNMFPFFCLFLHLGMVIYAAGTLEEEPRCSKYDFEEKVLQKMVRLEHKMELMTEKYDKLDKECPQSQQRLQDRQELQGKSACFYEIF